MRRDVKTSWKRDFELPVGVSLSARRQIEVMTAKLGSTPERNLSFPCERYILEYDHALLQGESIEAPAPVAFCVLQHVIANGDLLEIESDRQMTLRLHNKGFLAGCISETVGTYLVVPRAAASCRLLLKVLLHYRCGWQGRLLRVPARLVLSNLLHRDLLEIKRMAEGSSSVGRRSSSAHTGFASANQSPTIFGEKNGQ